MNFHGKPSHRAFLATPVLRVIGALFFAMYIG